jgi:hypothetical protein
VVRIEFESFLKLPHSVNIGSKNQLKVIEIGVAPQFHSILAGAAGNGGLIPKSKALTPVLRVIDPDFTPCQGAF